MSNVLLKNIGTIVSGDISNPLLEGDAIFVRQGKIQTVGSDAARNILDADVVIDCAGATVTPGLFDSHCHVVLGDYTPRQQQTGFLESEVHGGVTTFISAGEVHLAGRPKDPAGTKALAIVAAKSFANFRPGGGNGGTPTHGNRGPGPKKNRCAFGRTAPAGFYRKGPGGQPPAAAAGRTHQQH